MIAGQRETITFRRKFVRSSTKGNEFLPAQGIGAGLGEGLGIVLNQVIRGTSSYRCWVVRRATGTVVEEETAEYVTVVLGNKSSSGRRLKIRVSDIIRRKVFA